jgi:hypothetical protein
MSIDRPRRAASPHITPDIAEAMFSWIEQNVHYGLAQLEDVYLAEEVYGDPVSAFIELEERYGLAQGKLVTEFQLRLKVLAERRRQQAEDDLNFGAAMLDLNALLREVPEKLKAAAFLRSLPEPELLTALELGARKLADQRGRHADLFGYLEKVFRTRGLPYTASADGGIAWVGEEALREHAIEPALSVLTDSRLAQASKEFDKARSDLRRGNLKDAGKAAGDAVETTMSIVLGAHGHPQPQTAGGHDLIQAGALFDALKAKHVRLLDEERDHALIFAAIKVRHTCGHGAGANPKQPDPHYIEAGVAAAAVAITYLASKLP